VDEKKGGGCWGEKKGPRSEKDNGKMSRGSGNNHKEKKKVRSFFPGQVQKKGTLKDRGKKSPKTPNQMERESKKFPKKGSSGTALNEKKERVEK